MARDPQPENSLDRQVGRVGMYSRTILAVAAVCTLGAVGLTADLRNQIKEVREDLRAKAVADSLRFERVVEVVELAVVAVVEPDSSADQKAAIEELKRRRHVAP